MLGTATGTVAGSSPRLRGTLAAHQGYHVNIRLIPAAAGNTALAATEPKS